MARLLSNIVFWLLMAVLIPGAAVFVVLVYLPFVVLKAVWLALTGNLASRTAKASSKQTADA